jgi:hypothetical protein
LRIDDEIIPSLKWLHKEGQFASPRPEALSAVAAILMWAVHLTGVANSVGEARTTVGRPERPSLLQH